MRSMQIIGILAGLLDAGSLARADTTVKEPPPQRFRRRFAAVDLGSRSRLWSAPRGSFLVLYGENDPITAVADVPRPGRYTLAARAYQDAAGTEPAVMAIAIDGRDVARFAITSGPSNPGVHTVMVTLDRAGRHELSVRFVNDQWIPEQNLDRNLAVEWIQIDGPQSSLHLEAADIGVPGYDGRRSDQWVLQDFRPLVAGIQGNGGLAHFDICASQDAAGGEPAHLLVRLDGAPLGETDVRSTGSCERHQFSAPLPRGPHLLSLSFTNDLWDPDRRLDRNLVIRSIDIDQ
jgi:hypothetical protein